MPKTIKRKENWKKKKKPSKYTKNLEIIKFIIMIVSWGAVALRRGWKIERVRGEKKKFFIVRKKQVKIKMRIKGGKARRLNLEHDIMIESFKYNYIISNILMWATGCFQSFNPLSGVFSSGFQLPLTTQILTSPPPTNHFSLQHFSPFNFILFCFFLFLHKFFIFIFISFFLLFLLTFELF